MSVGTAFHPRTATPQPEDAVAGVGGLLRLLRVRRLPRHRVQRDPRGGRASSTSARSTSTASPGPTRSAWPTASSPATPRSSKVGQVFYTPWCDEHGKVIDDGTVHRVGEEELRWTAADPQYRWLTLNAAGLDVEIEDVTESIAALALQGPYSRAVLEAATGESFEDLALLPPPREPDRRRGDRRHPHRLHGRPGLRAVDPGRGRHGRLGRAVRGRQGLRDPAGRHARARRRRASRPG